MCFLCINHPWLLHINTLSLAPGSQWSNQFSYKIIYLQSISKVVTHIDTLEEGMATHSSILAWRIPIDIGAWLAIVHGVVKSWTCLERLRTYWYPTLKRGCNMFSRFLLKKKRQTAKLGLYYRGKIESIGPFFQCYQQDTLQPSSRSNGICEDLDKTYHLFVIFSKSTTYCQS